MTEDRHTPSEAEIIEALESLKPIPSARLYQKMELAPWVQHTRRSWLAALFGQRLMAAAMMMLVLGAVMTLVVPSLRAIADSTANSFLQFAQRADSDERVITYTARVLPDSYSETEQLLPFYFSVDQASQIAGFKIRVPPLLPNNYQLDGADARKDFVSLRYISNDALSSSTIEIQQWVVGSSTRYQVEEIGESALVETVQIGDLEGEYVEGHWQLVGTTLDSNLEPVTTITKIFHWQNRGGATLIWQDANIMYTLEANPGIRREDLLAIARCAYYPFDIREPDANLAGYRRLYVAKYIGCNLETNMASQTFASSNHLLVFRQQPVLQNIHSTLPVNIDFEETIWFRTDSGKITNARAIEGQWTDSLPETPRIADIDTTTRGIRWIDGDYTFELWAIGTGRGASLSTYDILEIARTIH